MRATTSSDILGQKAKVNVTSLLRPSTQQKQYEQQPSLYGFENKNGKHASTRANIMIDETINIQKFDSLTDS